MHCNYICTTTVLCCDDGGILGSVMNDEEEQRINIKVVWKLWCAEVERLWSIAKHILT